MTPNPKRPRPPLPSKLIINVDIETLGQRLANLAMRAEMTPQVEQVLQERSEEQAGKEQHDPTP